jgi:hypothetical protein
MTPVASKPGPLTASAERALIAAALLVGEPGEFRLTDLARFMNTELEPHLRPPRLVYSRGIRAHTLPSLERRGYVSHPRHGKYRLTLQGFEKAYELTGGRGLL